MTKAATTMLLTSLLVSAHGLPNTASFMVHVKLVFQLIIGSEGTPLYDELGIGLSEPRGMSGQSNPLPPMPLEELETPYYGYNKVSLSSILLSADKIFNFPRTTDMAF